jgi:Secretion system C-terminal sorting domain
LNISGTGKDTTISNLTDTTLTMPASFFTQDSTYNWTVSATDGELKTSTRPRAFTIREANSVNGSDPIARIFQLYPNYPNPFNPSTTIKFEMPRTSLVNLTVYDILGRQVSVLVNERRDAGVHEVKFDGSNLASGVYFYRLQTGGFVNTKKLLLVK